MNEELELEIQKLIDAGKSDDEIEGFITNYVETKKEQAPQKVDAPAEPSVTASSSEKSLSEFPTYTDNPETIAKVQASGFDAVPGARMQDGTIKGVDLPEVDIVPLEVQQRELNETIEEYTTKLSDARDVVDTFYNQNIALQLDENKKLPANFPKETLNEFYTLRDNFFEAAEIGKDLEAKQIDLNERKEIYKKTGYDVQDAVAEAEKIKMSLRSNIPKALIPYLSGIKAVTLDLSAGMVDFVNNYGLRPLISQSTGLPLKAVQALYPTIPTEKLKYTSAKLRSHMTNVRDEDGNTMTYIDLIKKGDYPNAAKVASEQSLSNIPSLALAIGFPIYGSMALGVSTAGSSFEENLKQRPDATIGELYLTSSTDGIFEWGTEYLGARLFRNVSGLRRVGTSEKVVKDYVRGYTTNAISKFGLGFATEGATEGANKTLQQLGDMAIFDDEIGGEEFFTNVIHDAGIGAFLGGPAASVTSVATKPKEKEQIYNYFAPQQFKSLQFNIATQIDAKVKQLETAKENEKTEIQEEIKDLNNAQVANKKGLYRTFNSLSDSQLKTYAQNLDAIHKQKNKLRRAKTDKKKELILDEINKYNQNNFNLIETAQNARREKLFENVSLQAEALKKEGVNVDIKKGETKDFIDWRRDDESASFDLGAIQAMDEVIKNPNSTKEEVAEAKEMKRSQTKQFEAKEEILKGESTRYGAIRQDGKGGLEIFINQESELRDGVMTTATHEFGHALLFATLQGNQDARKAFGDALLESFDENSIAIEGTDFKRRLDQYTEAEGKSEEVFTLAAEAVQNGDIKFNDNLFNRLKDVVRRFTKNRTGLEYKFNNNQDVFNFFRDYVQSVESGNVNKDLIKAAAKGIKGDILPTDIKPGDVQQFSKEASDKVQQIYQDQGVGGAMDIIDQFAPIVNRIVQKRSEAPNFDKQLLTDEINTGKRGIFDLIQEYKPESGVPLAAYVNKFLPARAIEASRRVLGEEFTDDVTEARGVAAEETVEQQPERKTKLKVLADQLNVADKVKSEVAEANIDPNALTNFKSVPNAAINTVGELLDIAPNKIKSKANLTATEVASAQRWFNKNARFVIDALPQGFDTDGKATGVPKTVLDALYTKREARAKTKAGLRTQVKRPNIKDSELLELVDIIDGKPTRNRNTSARVIALADLLGKVMTNQEIRQTVPGTERIRSGMSEVMFSKDDYNNINIEADGVPLIVVQKEQENINKLYKSQRDLGAIYRDNKTVLQAGAESINNFLKSYPKHREFIANTMTGGVTDAGFFLTKPEFDAVINEVSAKQSTEALDKGYRVKYNDKRKFIGEKLFQDKKFLADKKKRLPAMYDFFKDLESHLKTNSQDSWIFKEMAKDTGKHQNAFTRVLAPFTFYPAKNGKAITDQLVVEEHSMPQNNVMKSMLNAAVAGNVDEQFKVTKAAFMQGSFLETDDKTVNDSGMKKSMPDVFYDKIAPRIKSGELEVDIDGLLAVVRLAAAGTKYAPNNIGKTVNLNNYLIGETKQTIAEYFGIDKVQDIELANISLIENLAGEKEISYSKDIISKNISNVRPVLAYSKNSKGMSAFDFDETLIIDGENFIVAEKDGVKRKVVSGDWPIIGPQLAEEGYKFDFTDFVNVRGGVDGPLLQKMKNQIKKYSPKNVFVLTARPPQAATAIHEWLKTKDINIPFENITGLGNSTGDAKASWMLEKYQEGYNDMYFVDDALPNVKAVKHVFDQLDVKGKSVQARLQFSKDLNSEFNKMIGRTKGVAAEKTFSRVVGQKRGKNIGRYRFFVPPSAEDFAGLLYDFYGKGKQGDADMEFMKKALLDPFARADREMSEARMSILQDYKLLRKEIPNVKKRLGKLIEKDTGFTFDNAVRVYLFDKAGFEVPGVSKRDLNYLKNVVNTDQDLKTFADALSVVSKRDKGWIEPSENWSVESIASDLENIVNKIGRKQYLAEFIENKNIIFSPENMNKIEAIYGSRFRTALEDSLYRMENGTNRSFGKSYGQAWTNWVNGSVGAIMFFNARSAVLQTLSTVNFINFQDNNIFKAGKAFANQKQYWSDFSTLFNSDFLKARRAGLQINVNEAELANAVAGAQNKAKAALAYLLKKGFLPTQMADSFAIASGGSTFYRNRVETYTKQGMDQKAAEEKAFLDFQEIAQETQQSSRPDRISQQQASPLGRLVLAFANTPMQYNRLIKKASRDLINNRGDWRSNASRILYYGAIQNVIFASLQQAIFALSFDDEEDDAIDQRTTRIANGMLDTILRGSGVTGAAVATIKNAIMRFISESERESRADYGQVVVEALQVSPPMGAKARKVYSALNAYKFNRQIMGSMDTFDYNNPTWDAVAKVTTAATNVPLDRLFRKTDNIREAFNQENSAMQRTFLMLGWSSWDLQVGERVVVNKGKESQYVRYLDLKRQAQRDAKEELKKEKKENKKKNKNQCSFIKRDSSRCKNMVNKPKTRCYAHD